MRCSRLFDHRFAARFARLIEDRETGPVRRERRSEAAAVTDVENCRIGLSECRKQLADALERARVVPMRPVLSHSSKAFCTSMTTKAV
jgi:hypothetical protein